MAGQRLRGGDRKGCNPSEAVAKLAPANDH
jgi:hypothetical protein